MEDVDMASHAPERCTSFAYAVIHVVLDAMNIARGYKEYVNAPAGSSLRNALDVEALRLCFEYFHSCGICAKAFAAKGFIESHGEPLKDMQRQELLFATPGGLDDDFMLAHANRWGSWVISNDRFLDHVEQKGYRLDWIDYHRSGYMWDPNFELEPNAKRRMQEFAQTGKFAPGMQPGFALRVDHASSIIGCANHPSPRSQHLSMSRPVSTQTQPGASIPVPPDGHNTLAQEVSATPLIPAGASEGGHNLSSILQSSGEWGELHLEVPEGAVGRIIGKAGANIQALTSQTGCQVDVAKQLSPSGGTKRVTIRGARAAREAAAEIVMGKVATFLRYGCSPSTLSAPKQCSPTILVTSAINTGGKGSSPSQVSLVTSLEYDGDFQREPMDMDTC